MTSKPTQPTAWERFQLIKKRWHCAEWYTVAPLKGREDTDFLFALVDAAVSIHAQDRVDEVGIPMAVALEDRWKEIDQRLSEGKSK